MNETENQIRLRRAKEALSCARQAEATARKDLNNAVELTRQSKERYEALFLEEEKAEVNRRKLEYVHATK